MLERLERIAALNHEIRNGWQVIAYHASRQGASASPELDFAIAQIEAFLAPLGSKVHFCLCFANVMAATDIEAAQTYRACHGPTAEGKIGPSLRTTKLSENDVVLLLGKGNEARKMPYKKPMSSLTDDQIKAVARYVKRLK